MLNSIEKRIHCSTYETTENVNRLAMMMMRSVALLVGSTVEQSRARLDKIIHKGRRRREGQRDKLVYAEFR